MAWRVARSLLVLRDQLDAAYPGRSRASDGTIGDAAHQAQVSDHNPDQAGVVRALDITHDPGHGCDIDALSDALIGSRDPRISYVIANRLISGPDYGWQWASYDGDDPHTNHLHLSVVGDGRADDPREWNIGGVGGDMELTDPMTVPNWDRDPRLPAAGEGSTVGTALGVAQQRSWQAYQEAKAVRADLAALAARPAPAPTLTQPQLAAIGSAAAAQAATVVGSRVEDLEAQIADLRGLLVRLAMAIGGAGVELATLGTAQP